MGAWIKGLDAESRPLTLPSEEDEDEGGDDHDNNVSHVINPSLDILGSSAPPTDSFIFTEDHYNLLNGCIFYSLAFFVDRITG